MERFVDAIIEYAEELSMKYRMDIFVALLLAERRFVEIFGREV